MTWQLSGPSRIMAMDETLVVTRQPQAVGPDMTYVDGKPLRAAGSSQVYDCICNVQPVPGQDLMLMPEGDRHADMFVFYTMNATQTPDIGDLVARDGRTYQVHDSEEWGSYTRCRAVYVDTLPQWAGP